MNATQDKKENFDDPHKWVFFFYQVFGALNRRKVKSTQSFFFHKIFSFILMIPFFTDKSLGSNCVSLIMT